MLPRQEPVLEIDGCAANQVISPNEIVVIDLDEKLAVSWQRAPKLKTPEVYNLETCIMHIA